ncbi:hypothetical protein DFH06DRAFT_1339529 [Mycena polygramma]|nr:hypothetical protein DFH06DRAFT_1339529 [Mycena polygramma]
MSNAVAAANAEVQRRIYSTLQDCGVDADQILEGMQRSESIIAGSVTVAVLSPTYFRPNDIDIYCPEDEEDRMTDFLEDEIRCSLVKETDVRYPDRLSIKRILWFVKAGTRINLMVVKGRNATAAVFQFHSTVVMNILYYRGIYCAYPELTLRQLSIVNGASLQDEIESERTARCIEKYDARGITTGTKVRAAQARDGEI